MTQEQLARLAEFLAFGNGFKWARAEPDQNYGRLFGIGVETSDGRRNGARCATPATVKDVFDLVEMLVRWRDG